LPTGEDELTRGFIPALWRQLTGYEAPLSNDLYSLTERFSRAPDRGLAMEAFSLLVRTPRAVVGSGPARNTTAALESARYEATQTLEDYGERISRARAMGDDARVDRLMKEVDEYRRDWQERWGAYAYMGNLARELFGQTP